MGEDYHTRVVRPYHDSGYDSGPKDSYTSRGHPLSRPTAPAPPSEPFRGRSRLVSSKTFCTTQYQYPDPPVRQASSRQTSSQHYPRSQDQPFSSSAVRPQSYGQYSGKKTSGHRHRHEGHDGSHVRPSLNVYDVVKHFRKLGGNAKVGDWWWDSDGRKRSRDTEFELDTRSFKAKATRRDQLTRNQEGEGYLWTTSTNTSSYYPRSGNVGSHFYNGDAQVNRGGPYHVVDEVLHYDDTNGGHVLKSTRDRETFKRPQKSSSAKRTGRKWFRC